MATHTVTAHGYVPGSNASTQQPPIFDTTGQIAPPGAKPRVTATLWEDEGSLCYQVEAKGVCVARREGMFNATSVIIFYMLRLHFR
jgi:protein SOK2